MEPIALRTVSEAEAETEFRELLAAVVDGRERVLIERAGRPIAALVSPSDVQHLAETQPAPERFAGFLALAGAWAELGDEEIDAFVAHVIAEREQDFGRAVELDT